ncbi:MAG: metallophosphoesterase [Muribaculaceae bacterium]|nr:metallophosphoesterase [Muribaculaceae bacterium]
MRLPLPVIIILFAISILADLYIWVDIRQGKSKNRWAWSNAYAISSFLLWIFLGVIVALPRRGLDGGVYAIMWMLTVYLSIYVPKIIYCLFSILGRIPLIFRSTRWMWLNYVGAALGVIGFALVWHGILYTRSHTQLVNLTVSSERLPDNFDGYRIVQISDLHLGTWGNDTRFLSEFVNQVNNLRPDLIVFTGDLVNQKSDEIIPFTSLLKKLEASDGVYSILGNHDYGDYVDWPSKLAKEENLENLKKLQAEAGWKMLNNEHDFIVKNKGGHRDSIAIIGVENWGEPPFGKYGDLKKAYPVEKNRSIKDNNFKILLTHNPEHWVQEVRKITNIDLSLAGHTHAMQVSFDAFGKRFSPSSFRYQTWGGFYTENSIGEIEDFGNPDPYGGLDRNLEHPSLYVNIGAGEVGMPFRIGASNPEITLITLKKKKH